MPDNVPPDDAARSRRHLVAGAGLAAAALVSGALLLGGGGTNSGNSAEFGPEGLRTIEAVPDDLPNGIVPAGATDLRGTVRRDRGAWSASASFKLAVTIDEARALMEPTVTGDGWVERQRSRGKATLLVTFDHPAGDVLNITYRELPDGLGVAIVLDGTVT